MRERKHSRALWAAGLLVAILLLVASPALAAEEGGEAASSLTVAFKWLNFAIVAGAIGWLLVKKAPSFFAARAREIAKGIDSAAKVKAEAERQRGEAEARLRNLDQEIAAMRVAAKHDAEAEAGRIREATREEAAKVERAAQAEVAAAARAARMELKVLAARLAVQSAEGVVRAEMTPAAEDGMFQTFVKDLAGRRN
jgi:F0F1-type ATP synthase membrane subunit b/b'